MRVTFYGVRGSSPCHGPEIAGYGGNTSCVFVDVPGHDPILLDIGTGARYFGTCWPAGETFRGTCLLTHLHWDHVLGLPFFPPILREGGELTIHAPTQDDGRTVDDAFGTMLCPPFFPVGIRDLPGTVHFAEHGDDEFSVGDVRVTARLVPHIGPTLGYRLEWNGLSLAYISDHQQSGVDRFDVPEPVRELCDSVDLLIHDAQFTDDEFAAKQHWGHCTVEFACRVAEECNASTLALFHHDPTHDDEQVEAMAAAAQREHDGIRVVAAQERISLALGS